MLAVAAAAVAFTMTSQHESILKPTDAHGLILEAWAQGFTVGALIIMAGITVSNMRRGVLLHKLILVEVCALAHPAYLFEHCLTTHSLACLWHAT